MAPKKKSEKKPAKKQPTPTAKPKAAKAPMMVGQVEISVIDPNNLLTEFHKVHYATLRHAFVHDRTTMMACLDKQTNETVALVCGLNKPKGETKTTFVPLAIMCQGDPYERYVPPLDVKNDEKLDPAFLQNQLKANVAIIDKLREQLGLPPAIYPEPIETADEKNLEANFGNCPFCHSEDIDASDYTGDRTLSCKLTCNHCDGVWTELYRFIGGVDFHKGAVP